MLVRLLARGRRFEQRQRHIVRQPPHLPQRLAAIEPERAERVGVREQDQRALGQAGVAGEVFERGEGTAVAGGDDAVGPVLLNDIDLALPFRLLRFEELLIGIEPVEAVDLAEAEAYGALSFVRILQRVLRKAVRDIDLAHLDAVLAGIADDLGGGVKAHRLRIEKAAAERVGVIVLQP